AGWSGDGGGSGGRDNSGQRTAREEAQSTHEQESHWRRWGRVEDSATSGLGFMSALQRALILEQQQRQQEAEETDDGSSGDDDREDGWRGGGDRAKREAGGDRHALELLSVIAACCEGKNHFTEVQCRSMVSLEELVTLVTRG
ncbi:unnamed protein product, partial [Ectocarpus sp. 6 AP-2014]